MKSTNYTFLFFIVYYPDSVVVEEEDVESPDEEVTVRIHVDDVLENALGNNIALDSDIEEGILIFGIETINLLYLYNDHVPEAHTSKGLSVHV